MNVMFRTDASLQIGTGHVMRCLTLADALSAKGANCQFICREHPGNLIEFIRGKGYVTHALPMRAARETFGNEVMHAHWLGATQAQDAEACLPVLATRHPDWLIVDHYALDTRWECALAPHYIKLMVIDDLADRPHECNLLLDQNYGRGTSDYCLLVPEACHLLCGSAYALLRPEFAALRPYSLQRRAQPVLRKLLISMGGVDKDNVTGQILQALQTSPLPVDCRITVVMGVTAPWLEDARRQALNMPWPTQVLVGVSDMAQRMADCDLAIGAAGSTSWERCCLGVPTIMLALAENQLKAAQELERSGAAQLITLPKNAALLPREQPIPLINDSTQLRRMAECAANIVDGSGVYAVIQQMVG